MKNYIYFLIVFLGYIFIFDIHATTIHTIGDSHSYFSFVQASRSSLIGDFIRRSEFFLENLFDDDVPMVELQSIMKTVTRKINPKMNLTISNCYGYTLKIHWLGPITMHRVGRDGFNCVDFRDLEIKNGDIVVPTFGEIDCRCHILKVRDRTKKSIDEVIEGIVSAYVNVLNKNAMNFEDLRIVIFCGIPPAKKLNNPEFPTYGSFQDRVDITKRLVLALRKEADKFKDIQVLDITDLFADSSGGFGPGKSMDGCHVSPAQNYLIKERLGPVDFSS